MTYSHRPQVVVGTDGSLHARRAVAHAAGEAARRGSPLRVVTASRWAAEPAGAGLHPRLGTWTLADADVALEEAVDLAAELLPRAEITTVTGIGSPAGVLLAEARDAELLVIGNRGLGGISGLFLGSVGVELAGRTDCPLLIVREPGQLPPTDDAPVVVGVDGSPRSAPALRAAFLEAELAGAPLVVVHAWHVSAAAGPTDAPARAYHALHGSADERALLDALVRPYLREHPGVRVTTRVVQGGASPALVEAGAGARLLVVAARGRGELTSLLLGSTSRYAIQHAPCPVLLVRGSRADRAA